MLDSLQSLMAIAAIALTAWGLGAPVVSSWRVAGEDRLSRLVWSIGLGLIAAGLIVMTLGMLGLLNAALLRVLTVAGCGWGIGLLMTMFYAKSAERTEAEETQETPAQVPRPSRAWQAALYALCLLALTGSLLSALAPATAGDALCYHLELPKRYLQAEAIFNVPWHDNSTFPLLTEMWFAWGLALDGSVTAQLVEWCLGLLFAAAVVNLARPLIGREWSWTAGCLALIVPGVTSQMTAALNDIALAAFAALALSAWRNWLERQSHVEVPGNRSARAWLLRAGLAAGAALAIKYVALLFVAALGAATFWQVLLRRVPLQRVLLASLSIGVLAVAVAGTWYVRAAVIRGNPVYPFFASLAGDEQAPATIRDSKRALAWNTTDVISAPWQLTMSPDEFGGRGHQWGALFLATLPGVLLIRRLRGLSFLLLFAAAYGVLWFGLRQNLRFLLPALPALAIAATWVLMEVQRFPAVPKLLTLGTLGAAAAFVALLPVYRARHHVQVALGGETRAAYLTREEPSYGAAQFANEKLPPGANILSQDFRLFYFTAMVTRENIWRRETAYQRDLPPAELAQQLKDSGYSHVLLTGAVGSEMHYNATLSKLVDQAQETAPESFVPLYDREYVSVSGERRHYRLLEIR